MSGVPLVEQSKGYLRAFSSTGPCPSTSTHLEWNWLKSRSGLWDRITCSGDTCGESRGCRRQYEPSPCRHPGPCPDFVSPQGRPRPAGPELTCSPSAWDSSRALAARRQLPALVRKTTGTLSRPSASDSLRKASRAAGTTWLPRTSTPSMSKRKPKAGGCKASGGHGHRRAAICSPRPPPRTAALGALPRTRRLPGPPPLTRPPAQPRRAGGPGGLAARRAPRPARRQPRSAMPRRSTRLGSRRGTPGRVVPGLQLPAGAGMAGGAGRGAAVPSVLLGGGISALGSAET